MSYSESLLLIAAVFFAWLWYEATLRFVALLEAGNEERASIVSVIIITVLWPLFLVIGVVRNIVILPRFWEPNAPKIDSDNDKV